MRMTNERKAKNAITSHNITSARYSEFLAAGVPEFANWCQTTDRAKEIVSEGLTLAQWLPFRQERWDLSKYPVLTPKMIAAYVKRGMGVTDVKREMSRKYPAPMRTR